MWLPMSKLNNQVAIVTGARQGIGRGIALALAIEGAAITIAEKNYDIRASNADEINFRGDRSLPIVCDVRNRDEVSAVVKSTAI